MSSDQQESEVVERRRGQHLTLLDRGVIEAGLRAGRSFRAIARELKCSPGTVSNEVKRGTPERKSKVGRPPLYDGRRGQQSLLQNLINSIAIDFGVLYSV